MTDLLDLLRDFHSDLSPPCVSAKLKTIVALWGEVGAILGCGGFDTIVFVENTIAHERPAIYSKEDSVDGLWRAHNLGWTLIDGKHYNHHWLEKLGSGAFAHAWVNGRTTELKPNFDLCLTHPDYENIIACARATADYSPTGALTSRAGYPAELHAAIDAFEAVSGDPSATAKCTPKTAIKAWLDANRPELSINARARIATLANWQPAGGAPKTPAG